MDRQHDHDRHIFELAERQHGVVARRQLVDLGVPVHIIDQRLRSGRLFGLHRGVYALGHRALRREGSWLAGALACGADACLSHASAGLVWGIWDTVPSRIQVIVPVRSGRCAPRGVRLRRTGELAPSERAVRDGIPVTTVARTILDLAAIVRERPLEQVVRRAARLRLFDLDEQHVVVACHPRHRGAPRLAALLHRLVGRGTDEARSRLEVLFLQLADDQGLPRPVVNGHVCGIRVDFHWPAARLVVETDGFEWHSMPTSFEEDRADDQRLTLAGWTVVRFTYDQVRGSPERVVQTVVALLSR